MNRSISMLSTFSRKGEYNITPLIAMPSMLGSIAVQTPFIHCKATSNVFSSSAPSLLYCCIYCNSHITSSYYYTTILCSIEQQHNIFTNDVYLKYGHISERTARLDKTQNRSRWPPMAHGHPRYSHRQPRLQPSTNPMQVASRQTSHIKSHHIDNGGKRVSDHIRN